MKLLEDAIIYIAFILKDETIHYMYLFICMKAIKEKKMFSKKFIGLVLFKNIVYVKKNIII